MTIRIPEPTLGDKILRFFGKKRGLVLPINLNESSGYSVYAKARKENFWKALFRAKNMKFPENVIDYETFIRNFEELKGEKKF